MIIVDSHCHYPPVDAREGYGNALHGPLAQFADRTEEEREMIFGGTARALFPPRG